MISLFRSPADLPSDECMSRAARREQHGPPAVQAAGGGCPEPPRGPFGGGNRVSGGIADEDDDDLLASIDVLLAGLHPSPDGDVSNAVRLRAALGQAREACEQGQAGLARYIVSLVCGR